MVAQIKVDQSGKPAGVAGQAREDLDTGTLVTLSVSGGPFLAYAWTLIDAPPNAALTSKSTAVLLSPTSPTCQLLPDNRGTYLVRLSVDSGSGLGVGAGDRAELTFYAGPALAAAPDELPRRVPSFYEMLAHTAPDTLDAGGNVEGWAREWRRWFKVIEKSGTLTEFVLGGADGRLLTHVAGVLTWVSSVPVSGPDHHAAYALGSVLAFSPHVRMGNDGTEYLKLGADPVATAGDVRTARVVSLKMATGTPSTDATLLESTITETDYPGQVVRSGSTAEVAAHVLESSGGVLRVRSSVGSGGFLMLDVTVNSTSATWRSPGGNLVQTAVNTSGNAAGGLTTWTAASGVGPDRAGGGFTWSTGRPTGTGARGAYEQYIQFAATANNLRAVRLEYSTADVAVLLTGGYNRATDGSIFPFILRGASGGAIGSGYAPYGARASIEGGAGTDQAFGYPGGVRVYAGSQGASTTVARAGADVDLVAEPAVGAFRQGVVAWGGGPMKTAAQADPTIDYMYPSEAWAWADPGAGLDCAYMMRAKIQQAGDVLFVTETVSPGSVAL